MMCLMSNCLILSFFAWLQYMSFRITDFLNIVNGGLLGIYFIPMYSISGVLTNIEKTEPNQNLWPQTRDMKRTVDFVNHFSLNSSVMWKDFSPRKGPCTQLDKMSTGCTERYKQNSCSLTLPPVQTWNVSLRHEEPANCPPSLTSPWRIWTCGSLPLKTAVSTDTVTTTKKDRVTLFMKPVPTMHYNALWTHL